MRSTLSLMPDVTVALSLAHLKLGHFVPNPAQQWWGTWREEVCQEWGGWGLPLTWSALRGTSSVLELALTSRESRCAQPNPRLRDISLEVDGGRGGSSYTTSISKCYNQAFPSPTPPHRAGC